MPVELQTLAEAEEHEGLERPRSRPGQSVNPRAVEAGEGATAAIWG